MTTAVKEAGTEVNVMFEPLQSFLLIFGDLPESVSEGDLAVPLRCITAPKNLVCEPAAGCTRRICTSLAYPNFHSEKEVSLPDTLAKEKPWFSGWVQYILWEFSFFAPASCGQSRRMWLR